MEAEIIPMGSCVRCDGSIDEAAIYCQHCGIELKKALVVSESASLREAAVDFARGTATEAKSLSVEVLKSDAGKKVVAGAAMGAVAGAIIPLIGPAIGATLGAGYVAFKRLTK